MKENIRCYERRCRYCISCTPQVLCEVLFSNCIQKSLQSIKEHQSVSLLESLRLSELVKTKKEIEAEW